MKRIIAWTIIVFCILFVTVFFSFLMLSSMGVVGFLAFWGFIALVVLLVCAISVVENN